MKTLRHLCVALTLALTLTGSALAGEMLGSGIACRAPSSDNTDGEMLGPGLANSATEMILAVVEDTLSIL
jgi:hypothetical protein